MIMENVIVTTGRKFSDDMKILAIETADKLNLKFVERENFSIDFLKKIYCAENVLIAKNNSPDSVTRFSEFFLAIKIFSAL